MPTLNIQSSVHLNDNEVQLLANIFGCDITQLEDKLSVYGGAAIIEHIQMFLGQKVFTRGTDIKEYRLFLLIQSAFQNEIPDEQTVCNLFQVTLTESRSLIRSVMSKYQYQLKDAILNSVIKAISRPEIEGTADAPLSYIVDIKNENIVEELNGILADIDGSLPKIVRQPGTLSSRIIKPSAYNKLVEKFRIRPTEAVS